MQGNSILDVKKITGYLGKWSMDEEGTLMAVKIITDEIVTQKLTVGSASKPCGITIYDEISTQPYCIKIRNGAVVSDAGACGNESSNGKVQMINQVQSSNDTSTAAPAEVPETPTAPPTASEPAAAPTPEPQPEAVPPPAETPASEPAPAPESSPETAP